MLGDDRMQLDELRTHIRGKITQQFGERSRSVRRFKRTTDNQETFLVGNRYEETAHGRVTLTAKYSAEAIVCAKLQIGTLERLRDSAPLDRQSLHFQLARGLNAIGIQTFSFLSRAHDAMRICNEIEGEKMVVFGRSLPAMSYCKYEGFIQQICSLYLD